MSANGGQNSAQEREEFDAGLIWARIQIKAMEAREKRHPQLKRPAEERSLILRAGDPNDPLSDEERPKLLELPDLEAPVLGKALAFPNSLTEEEKMEVLLWPPDEIRRANVAQVAGSSVSLEEFLHRASTDVGFLTFDRIMFVFNDYNILPDDIDWNREKSLEREEAQMMVMPELEKEVLRNAEFALRGAGLSSQMEKLLAGELNEEDAAEERRKFALYRKRYDELVWDQEVLQDEATFRKPANPKSEEDLYLFYFSNEAKKQVQDIVSQRKELGFVFYPTAELRTVHIAAAEDFRTGNGGGFSRNADFNLRLAINHTLVMEGNNDEELARLRREGLAGLPFWPVREITVPFDFYFKEYLRFMLHSSKDTIPARIIGHAYGQEERSFVKLIRYQIADIEASETDLRPFRKHFRELRDVSEIKTGLDDRHFVLCSSDVTPDVCKAGASATQRQVWVIDADWEAPPGKTSDDDGYQGKLKVSTLSLLSL